MNSRLNYGVFVVLLNIFIPLSYGLVLNNRYCFNGDKPVLNCLHGQSGLCKPTNQSLPCVGEDHWNEKVDLLSELASCSLDYLSASECSKIDWPNFTYDARQPPFRLLLYRHNTWMTRPLLALNLSLSADIPTGIKFFFQHQHDSRRELCRKFSVVNPEGYFVDDDYEDTFDGLLDNLGDYSGQTDEENEFMDDIIGRGNTEGKSDKMRKDGVKSARHQSGSVMNKTLQIIMDNSAVLNTSSPSLNASEKVFLSNDTIPTELQDSTKLNILFTNYNQIIQSLNYTHSPTPDKLAPATAVPHRRHRRSSLPHILFWDCPMFKDGFEGQDFFLRLSDDAGWGAHLSFAVPELNRHDWTSTSLEEWSVFHYVHLEHVTLESSVPVTLQAAPFPDLQYNVSLRQACCVSSYKKGDTVLHGDGGQTNKRIRNRRESTRQPLPPTLKFGSELHTAKSNKYDPNWANDQLSLNYKNPVKHNLQTPNVDENGCYVCGNALASVIVSGPNRRQQQDQHAGTSEDTLLSAILPYQSTVGHYAVTVQILHPLCHGGDCYLAVSPVFAVSGRGYGRWVVVGVVVLLVLFLLSFTVMALIIRSQAEVASKKLWCRPRLLMVSCPYSPSSLSLTTSLSSFLHHMAAITTTTINQHLADADPYQWMQYEMRTANKVLFLVPPKAKTVAQWSPVPQQWRLGVLCYAASQGALSSCSSSCVSAGGGRRRASGSDGDKFALLLLRCSGPVPAQISHLQRFTLPDDLVSLVTWLHDGTALDRWFLWRPLVVHADASTDATDASTYRGGNAKKKKRGKKKKNSLIWSGCRRDQTDRQDASGWPRGVRGTGEGEVEKGLSRVGGTVEEGGGTREHQQQLNTGEVWNLQRIEGVKNERRVEGFSGKDVCDSKDVVGNGVVIPIVDNASGASLPVNCTGQHSNVGTGITELSLKSKEIKKGKSTQPRSSRSRSSSVESLSLDSSSTRAVNNTVTAAYKAGNDHDSDGGRGITNTPVGVPLSRPEWVNEILENKNSCGNNIEERMNFDVVQSSFSPTLAHLQEAVKLVELEDVQSQKKNVPRCNANNRGLLKPPSTSLNWLRRLFAKKKHPFTKPILDDVEEFSLYDNSVASHVPLAISAQHQHEQEPARVDPNNEKPISPKENNKDVMTASVSISTLCNVSLLNEDKDSSMTGGGNFDLTYDESYPDGVSPTALGDDIQDLDPVTSRSFDQIPSVSELPLLGEDLVSANTEETSSCQVEDDDDDFTAMLFGGTISD